MKRAAVEAFRVHFDHMGVFTVRRNFNRRALLFSVFIRKTAAVAGVEPASLG